MNRLDFNNSKLIPLEKYTYPWVNFCLGSLHSGVLSTLEFSGSGNALKFARFYE